MLSKRFKYNGKPATRLNELQVRMKKQIERKIEEGIYSFEEVPCCVCGGKNFEFLSEKDRYGLYVPVVICRDCGLIQTNPRMTQKAYNQFYDMEQKKLYVGKDIPTDKYFESQYERGTRIYAYIEKNLRIDLTDLKVLEVGTGAGGILYAFKEKGNEVYGCDLGSEYIAFGKEKYNLDLQIGTIYDSDINWTPDIVIYSHTLEHILNPVEELHLEKLFLEKPNLDELREVDAILRKKTDTIKEIWQMPVVQLPLRNSENKLCYVMRPVCSQDAMSADFYEMDFDYLKDIISEVQKSENVGDIFYDITTKPPGTIEWE